MYNGCSGSPTFAGAIQARVADGVSGSKEWLQPFGLCCTGLLASKRMRSV